MNISALLDKDYLSRGIFRLSSLEKQLEVLSLNNDIRESLGATGVPLLHYDLDVPMVCKNLNTKYSISKFTKGNLEHLALTSEGVHLLSCTMDGKVGLYSLDTQGVFTEIIPCICDELSVDSPNIFIKIGGSNYAYFREFGLLPFNTIVTEEFCSEEDDERVSYQFYIFDDTCIRVLRTEHSEKYKCNFTFISMEDLLDDMCELALGLEDDECELLATKIAVLVSIYEPVEPVKVGDIICNL
jgi:hypothetical protein